MSEEAAPQSQTQSQSSAAVYARVGSYDLLRTIGHGNFSVCKLAEHRITNQTYAIKCIQKKNLDSVILARVYREIEIMKSLDHPNIIKLHQVMESKSMLYLVCEYASNGEIFDYILKHGAMTEKMACEKFCQIVSAVEFCHLKEIAHRDLKSENLLFDANMNIKLIDFGFANYFDLTNPLKTFCGSPPYAAPEIFCGKKYYGPEIDIWSLGVLLYVLVCGALPFDSENLQQLKQKVVQCKYRIPYFLSADCENLLANILVVNPSKRFKLQQIKAHKWIKTNSSSTYFHLFNGPTTTTRRRFNRISNKFKSRSMKNLSNAAAAAAAAAAAVVVSSSTSTNTNANTNNNTTPSNNAIRQQQVVAAPTIETTAVASAAPSPIQMIRKRLVKATPAISQLSLPLYSFEQYYPLRVTAAANNPTTTNAASSNISDMPPAVAALVAENLPNLVSSLSLASSSEPRNLQTEIVAATTAVAAAETATTSESTSEMNEANRGGEEEVEVEEGVTTTEMMTTTNENDSKDREAEGEESEMVTTTSSLSLQKRGPADLKCPAFANLVSNSSSLDEGVESDLSSPISSTFSFANGRNNGYHHRPLPSAYLPHYASHHYYNMAIQDNNNASSSTISSCLTSFESHCCPSPVSSILMKTSIDDAMSTCSSSNSSNSHAAAIAAAAANSSGFMHHSTSCAAASASEVAMPGTNKKHSLPASLALNRKYKFSTLKRNFFIRYKHHHQSPPVTTNNISQLKHELNSLIRNSTPRESITSLNSDEQQQQQPQEQQQSQSNQCQEENYSSSSQSPQTLMQLPLETTSSSSATTLSQTASTTTTSPTENNTFQKYRHLAFFKSHKKKSDANSTSTNVASNDTCNNVNHATTTNTTTITRSSTRVSNKRNLLRQKSTSLHSLVDEKVNPTSNTTRGSSSNSANTSTTSTTSTTSKVKSTAGNLTRNLNSKFKFYRKYSLKN